MSNIYKNTDNFILIDDNWLTKLADEALQSEKQMSRLLVHTSPDQLVQEMLIAFTANCPIKPNQSANKSESLTVLRGEVRLVLFDNKGNHQQVIDLAPVGQGKPYYYRFTSTPWHTMLALSSVAVVHEVIEGPFVPSKADLPGWIPDNNEDLAKLVERFKCQN